MKSVREPAVAGMFYPWRPERLKALVDGYVREGRAAGPRPKAIIVPHAGYVYSGPVAGSAYATLASGCEGIERVVLLGPAHRLFFEGLATSGAAAFRTPLGDVPVDGDCVARLVALPQVCILDEAHGSEHCLEVQLPFLQELLGTFRIVPVVVGRASTEEVREVVGLLWGGDETLIVISSDLSHYEDQESARAHDRATAGLIEGLTPVGGEDACGYGAINGFLAEARRRHLHCRLLDLRTSGDTSGDTSRVVGYGAFRFDP